MDVASLAEILPDSIECIHLLYSKYIICPSESRLTLVLAFDTPLR